MIITAPAGLKVVYADLTLTSGVSVALTTASILGAIQTSPAVHGCCVIETALGATATGIPHKVISATASIDGGIISVSVTFSAEITRDVRVAIFIKE